MTVQRFLLDTNIILFLELNPGRVPDVVMQQIIASPVAYMSAVSAWEISIKQSIGSLSLQRPVSQLIQERSFTELPVTIRHGEAVRVLPFHHRDPFDRMLVAQAQVEGLTLVTADRMLSQYSVPVLLV